MALGISQGKKCTCFFRICTRYRFLFTLLSKKKKRGGGVGGWIRHSIPWLLNKPCLQEMQASGDAQPRIPPLAHAAWLWLNNARATVGTYLLPTPALVGSVQTGARSQLPAYSPAPKPTACASQGSLFLPPAGKSEASIIAPKCCP